MVTQKQEKHHLCAFFVRVIKAISAGLMSVFFFFAVFYFWIRDGSLHIHLVETTSQKSADMTVDSI